MPRCSSGAFVRKMRRFRFAAPGEQESQVWARTMVLGPVRYAGPFLLVLSIPLFYYAVGPLAPLLTVALLLLLLIAAECLAPGSRVLNSPGASRAFRLVP